MDDDKRKFIHEMEDKKSQCGDNPIKENLVSKRTK